MSATQVPMGSGKTQPGPGAPAAPGDPSMEDILASIRKILSEDETPAVQAGQIPPEQTAPVPDAVPDVLILEPSMLIHEMEAPPAPEPPRVYPRAMAALAEPAPLEAALASPNDLVAPEAAAAAASSVGNLVRTLTAERAMHVYSGGPTIEDIVREEIRVLLKQWLDANLPPLVDRLVAAEIARVVRHAAP
jgi:cell pole-organizing protein PopZ